MRSMTISFLLIVIAIIHLAPISGFAGASKLQSLYGIAIEGANLEILMRHRAVLFGILGVFFLYAAFRPALQPMAFLAAFATLASFFYLAFSVGGYNAAIQKVVNVDIVAIVSLGLAVLLYYTAPQQ